MVGATGERQSGQVCCCHLARTVPSQSLDSDQEQVSVPFRATFCTGGLKRSWALGLLDHLGD